MTFTRTALAAVLALGTAAVAAPASAQQAQAEAPKITVSAGARKSIAELQAAVNAKDVANIPAKLAAAQAAAKTKEDRYFIAQLQLRAAVDSNNEAAKAQAIDAILASGGAPADMLSKLRISQAQLKYNAKDYAGASAAVEPLVAAEPNNADALALLADIRNRQGRPADALSLFQKAAAAKKAAGQPVPKDWAKRAVALAYNNKLPSAGQLALDWVRSDPSPANWRDAIQIYADTNQIAAADRIDVYRLQRAAGALKGESDYYTYANGAATRGLPGEAKAVLDEGFAAQAINRSRPVFRDVYASASSKIAADKAGLATAERSALASATARPAMVTGDAYLGYGDYGKAIALYRAALGKTGVDKDLANLRLGIAQARSGDKAGATASFNAVTGVRAPIAKLWLTWLGAQA